MQDFEQPIFYRWVSAKAIMKRWGIDEIKLMQLHPPLKALVQTGVHDHSKHNALTSHWGNSGSTEGLERVRHPSPNDFDHAFYDVYDLERFEAGHPGIVKDETSAPELNKNFYNEAEREKIDEYQHKLRQSKFEPPEKEVMRKWFHSAIRFGMYLRGLTNKHDRLTSKGSDTFLYNAGFGHRFTGDAMELIFQSIPEGYRTPASANKHTRALKIDPSKVDRLKFKK